MDFLRFTAEKTDEGQTLYNKTHRVTVGNDLDRSEKVNGLPRLLRRLAMTDQCHSERSEESVFLKKGFPNSQPSQRGRWHAAGVTKEGL